MKKYKLTLLIGIITIVFFAQISKPNSGLDNDTLFKLLNQTSNNINNFLQINKFSITKSAYNGKIEPETVDSNFFKSFFNYLLKKEDKEQNNIKNPVETLDVYRNTSRYEMMFNKSSEPSSFFISDYSASSRSNIQTQNYIKKDSTGVFISKNSINTDNKEPVQLNPFEKSNIEDLKFLHYTQLVDILKTSSNFIDYTEIDEKYVFKQEFKSINNAELTNLFENLKLDKAINDSDVLKYEDLINENWDNEAILINFIIPSNQLHVTNFILSIDLIKDDIQYSMHLSMDFEQFNILSNFSIPKELQ